MEKKIRCQSCGIPMDSEASYGTDSLGAETPDYCIGCFKNGAFTFDISMEEMLFFSTPQTLFAVPSGAEENAFREMRALFSSLKRWAS